MPLLMVMTVSLIVCSCFFFESSNDPEVEIVKYDPVYDGFLIINPAGQIAEVSLGSSLENVPAKETPSMKVFLDYPFSIEEHEVTCGEYKAYMKTDCSERDLPITDITYYDAVLFANEKSKAERMDTAYTYNSMEYDGEGHCIWLENIAFDAGVNAYRLPTEAEWVYAASKDFSPAQSWHAGNSSLKLNKVCSAGRNGNLLCDMAGNAMEWVNDWLGYFRDTTILNYVGAPDGGGIGERVVKGGSFRNDMSAINLYSRGDIYTVTSSTRAAYVGFRLAVGAIKSPAWMDNDGNAVSSGVNLVANASLMHSLLGTYKVKLAFRNDVTGNLAYVSYAAGGQDVVQIRDTMNVYHPVISPDGKKVAFCTGLEGVGGKSQLYVRDLNASGSNLVKLNVESAVIPRWRVTDNGDTVIVYVDDAGNNKTDADFLSHSTWQVKFQQGKFGTPEKLFDGAYHGGVSSDNHLAVTGARLMRVHKVVDKVNVDTVWYGGEQACNVSLAPDDTRRTVFLDFGGELGRKFVGMSYDVHERLLVVDSLGLLVQSVAAPSGYAFDHSEWVKHPFNAGVNTDPVVATLTNANGAHEKIVLVNLKDSSITPLVEGQELWHPDIWTSHQIVDGGNLNLDSAGVYLTPASDEYQARFRIKMELFWKNLDETEVILVGSSRMERGVNPDLFPEWNMLNFGVMGPCWGRDFYFAKNYVLNHSGNLKSIVIGLDIDAWRDSLEYLDKVIHTPGYVYDAAHNFWKDGVPDNFVDVVLETYDAPYSLRLAFSDRGNFKVPSDSWGSPVVVDDSIVNGGRKEYLDHVLSEIEYLIDECEKRKIHLVGTIFPQNPGFKKTGSLGIYGIQRSVAEKMIEKLKTLDQASRYFHLFDENKMGDHDYSDKMASDLQHLSALGAKQLTVRLDSLLKTLDLR